MAWLYASVAGIGGVAIGAFVSQFARQGADSISKRIGARGNAARAMNAVVMEVPSDWDGYSYRVEDSDLTVVGMQLLVRVTNHSDQLIKNLHVRMLRPPGDVDTAKFVPAIPAGQTERFLIARTLGLVDDGPFEEEEPGWIVNYEFEADFDDTDGRGWRLSFDPLTWTQ